MNWQILFPHRWQFFLIYKFSFDHIWILYYYHAIHGNIWIITYSVFKYTNFRSLREWVLVFTFNKYFIPFTFSFTFFMSVYSAAAGSVVYIYVVHNSFWLLCHIHLGAAPTFSASAALTGVVSWKGWMNVGQIKAAGQTCLSCTPRVLSPYSRMGTRCIVTLCSLFNELIIFLILCARCALSIYNQNSNTLQKINSHTSK